MTRELSVKGGGNQLWEGSGEKERPTDKGNRSDCGDLPIVQYNQKVMVSGGNAEGVGPPTPNQSSR